jgi:hypothetical protein
VSVGLVAVLPMALRLLVAARDDTEAEDKRPKTPTDSLPESV